MTSFLEVMDRMIRIGLSIAIAISLPVAAVLPVDREADAVSIEAEAPISGMVSLAALLCRQPVEDGDGSPGRHGQGACHGIFCSTSRKVSMGLKS
jgi:hypothetical protein